MPSISAAPLPPLPPVVDDAAAQKCFVQAGEFESTGERDKAIEQYTNAIRLNAKHTMAYFKRGVLLMGMGFKPAAVADFRRVIEIADNPELTDVAKANIAKPS
jgi:tetratricopeptide (TPR) repeat protein